MVFMGRRQQLMHHKSPRFMVQMMTQYLDDPWSCSLPLLYYLKMVLAKLDQIYSNGKFSHYQIYFIIPKVIWTPKESARRVKATWFFLFTTLILNRNHLTNICYSYLKYTEDTDLLRGGDINIFVSVALQKNHIVIAL